LIEHVDRCEVAAACAIEQGVDALQRALEVQLLERIAHALVGELAHPMNSS